MKRYAILTATLLAHLCVLAEGETATAHGRVTDPDGAAIAEAGVFHPHRGTKTDADGKFSFQIPTNTVVKYPARAPSINITLPTMGFYDTRQLDLSRVAQGLSVDLGTIVMPMVTTNTMIKRKHIGDADVFLQSMRMRDESRNLTAILVPCPYGGKKGEFELAGLPSGDYVLTNVTKKASLCQEVKKLLTVTKHFSVSAYEKYVLCKRIPAWISYSATGKSRTKHLLRLRPLSQKYRSAKVVAKNIFFTT